MRVVTNDDERFPQRVVCQRELEQYARKFQIKATSPNVKVGFSSEIVKYHKVLYGSMMQHDMPRLDIFLKTAAVVSRDHPVVISKYITGAKEVEMDAIGNEGELVNYAIAEHIENAGVHSGDATLLLPAQRLFVETHRKVKSISQKLCKALKISGLQLGGWAVGTGAFLDTKQHCRLSSQILKTAELVASQCHDFKWCICVICLQVRSTSSSFARTTKWRSLSAIWELPDRCPSFPRLTMLLSQICLFFSMLHFVSFGYRRPPKQLRMT